LLDDAQQKSRRSYDMLTREYRLGLVNNLDVLQAMNDLQNVKRDFDVAQLQSKLNLLNLRLAAEMTPDALP
jgi:outer membrane protein TolC